MADVGLKRGTVQVVPYNPEWAKSFEEEKSKLQKAFSGRLLSIEHVGSTAVPGLAAKPLIDMMAAIPALSQYHEYVEELHKFGYEYMPGRVFDDRVFFPKGPRSKRTHHLNLVEVGSEQWHTTLNFRDYLRDHADKRKEYQELKENLAKLYPNNCEAYTKAKNQFIQDVLTNIA